MKYPIGPYNPLLGNLSSLSDDALQTKFAKLQHRMALAQRSSHADDILPQMSQMLQALQQESMLRTQKQMWEERLRTDKQSWSSDDGLEDLDGLD